MEKLDCCGPEDKASATLGLPCIKFEGEEKILPSGVQIRDPTLQLYNLFTNWDTSEIGLDLKVDEDLVSRLNDMYNGRGVVIGDPVTPGKWYTVAEWTAKFNSNGILLAGIKSFFRKKFGPGAHAQLTRSGKMAVVELGEDKPEKSETKGSQIVE